MKTKSLFLGALTCLAFAACSDDDKVVNPNGSQAENSTAVIAVSFSMPSGGNATKAWSNDDNANNYIEGDDYETKVNSAMLYFYKGNTLWQAVDVINNITEWSDDNVSNTIQLNSNVFITLENVSENNYPDRVVAVLNGPNDLSTETFSELIANISKTLNTTNITSDTEGNFVMSNAVYNDATTMNYTPVTKNNFGTGSNITEAQNNATNNKLNIIVERVLARVNVANDITTIVADDNNSANTHAFATVDANGKITSTSTTRAVLANLKGWWLDNTNSQSNLVKSLEPSYAFSYDSHNFTWGNWNDEANKRSYWATAINSNEIKGSNKFQHYYYSQYNNQDKYCYENTNMDNPTRLVVAATLEIDGTAQDLVQHNTLMWTSADFLKNVEYQLKQQYKGITISSTNLKLVWNTQETAANGTITENNLETRYEDRNEIADNETREIKDYEAMVQVNVDGSTITESSTFSYTDANDATQSLTISQLNEAIEDILRGPVKFWNEGQTYFFTEIAQLEETAVVDEKNVKYILPGIIRNHLYKINITSVVGLGTPVPTEPQSPEPDPTYPEVPDPTPDPDPDPDQPIIPETPEDDEISAIAAQISILKYRVVNQSVDLQ